MTQTHSQIIRARLAATLNTSPAAPTKTGKNVNCMLNANVNCMLDVMDDRRAFAAQRSSACSSFVPTTSFYPGYSPEETDDGRLDAVVKTGFVSIDQIADEHKDYVITDEDYKDDDSSAPTFVADESPRSGGPASTRDYLGEFAARLPRRVEIYCASRACRVGGQLIPYRPLTRRAAVR